MGPFILALSVIEAKLNKGLQKRRKRSSTRICSEGAKDFSSAGSSEAATEAGNGTCHDPESAHRCRGECADLRTEIAIVLDGSGSIEAEDFIWAKEFIYNVMKAFYEKCFECVFALVQYGNIIWTEFDLREGKVANGALEKVQAVKQVYNVTRTASAIQHVLDSIFNESCGSQKNASKKIIVLTDGETFLDTLDLKTVISSERMAGIDRYAIGVSSRLHEDLVCFSI
ncbi:integrin alpha-E-like [Hemicordylus capensis]|uniref:integrin alpha-E-like n=1 Tax=Hemicordylus capensis TaxID=884348 RepID=UPI0023044FFE|nr:integrin alpha-E-like [Hemicordylus capensis]